MRCTFSIICNLSYSVHPVHRQLWLGSGEGRKTAVYTHRGECGERVPRLKKCLQRERNLQLSKSLQITPTLIMNSKQLKKYTQQIEYIQITKNTIMLREVVKNNK